MNDQPSLPSTPANMRTEREGILAVAVAISRLGQIWRETPMADVGIDGQIEMVNEGGFATGQLAAVQVKSGDSYFNDGGEEWRFYPADKHRFYWERFPIPVLLILHSPSDGISYWVDARNALKSPERSQPAYIAVPKHNVLQRTTAAELFRSTGLGTAALLPLDEILQKLLQTHSANASFPLSYLDLFANGLINLARSIYCSIDLALQVAEELLSESELDTGVGVGPSEHEFLFGFILFLAEQHLAVVDLDQCLIDWFDHGLQPTFIAPLTSRGRALVSLIGTKQDALEARGKLTVPDGCRVAQEGLVMMFLSPSHQSRIALIRDFQRALLPVAEPSDRSNDSGDVNG